MKVRSVTLHLTGDEDLSIVEKFLDVAKAVDPATVRVSISPRGDVGRLIPRLRDLGVKYISALHLRYDADEVYSYVSQYGVFASLSDVVEYMRFLKRVHVGEVHLARYVALSLGGAVYNSPYFPLSVTTRRGVSISLLYPNDLNSLEDVETVLKRGEEVGMQVASSLGVEFIGVDGSLSPWGHESVAKAVERLFNIRLGAFGSHDAIYKINQAIERAGVKKTGFNEVMLPVAEDEEIKRLVREGALNLDKLVSYTAVCVPGLDMAPVKIREWGEVKRLLYDLAAISATKRRVIGVRIFPVDVDEYDVEGFGKTPAL
ncbi:MAG: DUF711 family protein [Pyrobaculum sp.]